MIGGASRVYSDSHCPCCELHPLTTNACSQEGHVDVARLLIEKGAEVPHSDTLTPHYYGSHEGDDSYDMYLCMTGVL